MSFQFLSTIKVNLVAKIVQSAYLCVIFHVKHRELLFLAVLTWFLILGKIQDGDHCCWRHRPPAALPPRNIPLLVKKIKGLPLKVKSFRNTATYQKLWGGVPSTPPPPCTTVGVWICLYVRGLNSRDTWKTSLYCHFIFNILSFDYSRISRGR